MASPPLLHRTSKAPRVIGQGANGIVELHDDGTVVKRLRDYLDRQSVDAFHSELRMVSSLSHRHIVKGRSVQIRKDCSPVLPAMAMEYLQGGSIQALLTRQMQNPTRRLYAFRDALRWCTQLASALAYLHSRDPIIVFRDLSAANVLLTSTVPGEADIKLADFGLHKLLSQHALPPDNGEAGKCGAAAMHLHADSGGKHAAAVELTGETGAYTFMSPEVMKHEAYNEKVDVFSLGCLMHELFGRQLRSAAVLSVRIDATLLKQYALRVADGYRPAMPHHFPEPLAALISTCWAQRPVERPSAAAVHARLQLMADTGALDAMDVRARGLFACLG